MDFLNLALKESTRVFMCEFVMVVFFIFPDGERVDARCEKLHVFTPEHSDRP